jgi:hypothetical protein
MLTGKRPTSILTGKRPSINTRDEPRVSKFKTGELSRKKKRKKNEKSPTSSLERAEEGCSACRYSNRSVCGRRRRWRRRRSTRTAYQSTAYCCESKQRKTAERVKFINQGQTRVISLVKNLLVLTEYHYTL